MGYTMNQIARITGLVALLAALLLPLPVRAADTPAAAVETALRWLSTQQQDDGSFPGFGAGTSADVALAYAAAGIDPNSVLKNGNSPISFLGNKTAEFASSSVGGAGKLTLAVVAAGKDPRSFGGVDLPALIKQSYNTRTRLYGNTPTDHAYAILALISAGEQLPAGVLDAAGSTQLPDGGWSFDGTAKTGSDTNTTALVIQALAAGSARTAVFNNGLAYLKSQQNADGGFPYSKTSPFGSDSDANSTSLVIQALVAAGEDPRALKQASGDPVSALLALQNANGAFRYQAALPDDNMLATVQAIPALSLKPFPLKILPTVAAPVPATLPNTSGTDLPLLALFAALALIASGWLMRRVAR